MAGASRSALPEQRSRPAVTDGTAWQLPETFTSAMAWAQHEWLAAHRLPSESGPWPVTRPRGAGMPSTASCTKDGQLMGAPWRSRLVTRWAARALRPPTPRLASHLPLKVCVDPLNRRCVDRTRLSSRRGRSCMLLSAAPTGTPRTPTSMRWRQRRGRAFERRSIHVQLYGSSYHALG